jgi:hypothetical protein
VHSFSWTLGGDFAWQPRAADSAGGAPAFLEVHGWNVDKREVTAFLLNTLMRPPRSALAPKDPFTLTADDELLVAERATARSLPDGWMHDGRCVGACACACACVGVGPAPHLCARVSSYGLARSEYVHMEGIHSSRHPLFGEEAQAYCAEFNARLPQLLEEIASDRLAFDRERSRALATIVDA